MAGLGPPSMISSPVPCLKSWMPGTSPGMTQNFFGDAMPSNLQSMIGRLFGIEAKASRTAKLIAWTTGGQPVWTPRDLSALAREGFAKNAIVYRAVRMIAEAAASVPLFLFEGEREVDAHPLLDLLARPNPMQCGPDLLEAWYGHLMVAGNAYLEAVSVAGTVRELHALRPDRMK